MYVDMEIAYKTVLLVTVFYVSRLTGAIYEGYYEDKYGDEFEPAYIRLKVWLNQF